MAMGNGKLLLLSLEFFAAQLLPSRGMFIDYSICITGNTGGVCAVLQGC